MRCGGSCRTFSELCVTVGALIVLFVVYVLFWTGVKADNAMDGEIGKLQDQWSTGSVTGPGASRPRPEPAPGSTSAPAEPPRRYTPGKLLRRHVHPAPWRHWAKPVLEGTATDILKQGLGHYARTARLGRTGNFSVAGHRRTYGDPFKDFPKLRPGDAVVLTDGTTWFTYRIDNRPYTTLPARHRGDRPGTAEVRLQRPRAAISR